MKYVQASECQALTQKARKRFDEATVSNVMNYLNDKLLLSAKRGYTAFCLGALDNSPKAVYKIIINDIPLTHKEWFQVVTILTNNGFTIGHITTEEGYFAEVSW